MRLQFQGFQAQPASPATEILDALAQVPGPDLPNLLAYTPVARMNPFQSLLYTGFHSNGFAVAPILKPDTFLGINEFKRMASSASLHLHWNGWMTYGESRLERARHLGEGILGRLARLRDAGINVIWTVHNLYPHDALHLELELELQQKIAEISNVVHVMSRSTLDVMQETMRIDPSKVLYSPHPSYRGAYQNYVSRADARAMLGLDPDEVVFLIFGALKPYKGLSRLYTAFDQLVRNSPHRRYRLLVAGASDDSNESVEFVRRCLSHPNVLVDNSKVSSDRVQYFMNAADVGLVTYSRVLNSGAAFLYQTFGLPVVAADVPQLRENLLSEASVFVGPSVEECESGLLQASEKLMSPQVRELVLKHMDLYDPGVVGDAFARALKSRLA